jgi:hypothetical protein
MKQPTSTKKGYVAMLTAEQAAEREKAIAWMRLRLSDVPDRSIEIFSKLLDECCEVSMGEPTQNRLKTRSDHIEHLAWYFWMSKAHKNLALEAVMDSLPKGAQA